MKSSLEQHLGMSSENSFSFRDEINKCSINTLAVRPRYDLTPEECAELEGDLLGIVEGQYPEEGVCAVWINPYHRFANLIRAKEAEFFPEVEEVSEQDESNTLFLALVDTRPGSRRLVHGATITGVPYEGETPESVLPNEAQSTGFITVDSLIELGNFTAQGFQDYYKEKGIDLDNSFAVETNFRVGDKVEPYQGVQIADLAYLTMFSLIQRKGINEGVAVFASINRASITSFGRVGLEYEPLMGREDMKTPEAALGLDYLPVAIPLNENNRAMFEMMSSFNLPEISL